MHFRLPFPHHQRVAVGTHFKWRRAIYRIVFQKVREVLDSTEVVDSNDVYIRAAGICRTHESPADPAESVDCDFHCKSISLRCTSAVDSALQINAVKVSL